jgi:membrane protease YdiL (CAAX protease family)
MLPRCQREFVASINARVLSVHFDVFTSAGSFLAPQALGLGRPASWFTTASLAAVWLALMLAYSPIADALAARWIKTPPTLTAFRALKESRLKLIVGIVVAWILGGFLEEIVFRGIVLRLAGQALSAYAGAWLATGIAVCIAACGAGLLHFYQGRRAMVIITQLSVLFGMLFVASGYNLWSVILCHGLYDTVALIRFANGTSRYSQFDAAPR